MRNNSLLLCNIIRDGICHVFVRWWKISIATIHCGELLGRPTLVGKALSFIYLM